MENQEKIQAFADMVAATERMSKPWRAAVWMTMGTLILSNVCWAAVLAVMILT